MTHGEAAPDTFTRVTLCPTLFLHLAAAPIPTFFDQVKTEDLVAAWEASERRPKDKRRNARYDSAGCYSWTIYA